MLIDYSPTVPDVEKYSIVVSTRGYEFSREIA